MTSKAEILAELIQQAAVDHQVEAIAYFVGLLKQEVKPKNQPQTRPKDSCVMPLQGMLAVQPVASPMDVHRIVCTYVSNRVSETVKFCDIAHYVESTAVLPLDRELVPNERRERWRNHVSMSINRLRSSGVLIKGENKNSHYTVAKRP